MQSHLILSQNFSQWARGGMAVTVLTVAASAHALDGDEYSLRQAISEASQAIQGEFLKGASAQKAIMEGIATYRAQSRLQNQAVTLQRDMKQAEQLCQAMDAQVTLSAGAMKTRARVAQDQRKSISPIARNQNTLATVDSMHRASNDSFCAEEEARQGICKATVNPKYTNLAGADQNAMYLFQSRTGGDTYEGTHDAGQVEAVDAYISRVVAGGVPPELLKMQGAMVNSSNSQARAYIELARRYQAFLSMASYSMNAIKGSRTPAQ